MAQQTPPVDDLIRAIIANPLLMWFFGLGITGGVLWFFVRLTRQILGNGNGGKTQTLLDKQQILIDNAIRMNTVLMAYFEQMQDITEHNINKSKEEPKP